MLAEDRERWLVEEVKKILQGRERWHLKYNFFEYIWGGRCKCH